MSAAEPDGDNESSAEPTGTGEGPADHGHGGEAASEVGSPSPSDTREQPFARVPEPPVASSPLAGSPAGDQMQDAESGDQRAETEIRPGPADLPRPGPLGSTSVLPPVRDEIGAGKPAAPPTWSARAQVRVPDLDHDDEHEEWAEPGRSPLVPILVGVCVVLLIALLGLGGLLIFADRLSPTTPSTTPTVQTASPPPTSAGRTSSSAPTASSAAPTAVPLPNLRGQDYATAAATLTSLGFKPVRRDETDGEVAKGKVTGTDPPTGTTVLPGATINIIVSAGPPSPPTPSPSPSES